MISPSVRPLLLRTAHALVGRVGWLLLLLLCGLYGLVDSGTASTVHVSGAQVGGGPYTYNYRLGQRVG